jgi:hypothetical protein
MTSSPIFVDNSPIFVDNSPIFVGGGNWGTCGAVC